MEKKIKTILILGGYGFIATNIIKFIETNNLPFKVIVFDHFESHPHGITSPVVIKNYAGDFSNNKLIERIFQENKFDIIIHALSTTVASNADNPSYDIESNVLPSLYVLDMMVKYKVKDIVFISSGGAIYGKQKDFPHKETDVVSPISPYGVGKSTIEKYMMLYSSLYDIKPLILRLSNPYGFYHYSTKQGIINVALKCAKDRLTFNVFGNGNGRKDYIWIDDFVDIMFILLKKQISNTIINIASGELLSVNEVIAKIKGYYPEFNWQNMPSLSLDVQDFQLDISYLKSIIGNYTFTPFEIGLQKLINE